MNARTANIVSLIVLLGVAAVIVLVLLLAGCTLFKSGPAMISGPKGEQIVAPPEGTTYNADWELVPIPQPAAPPKPTSLWWLYIVAGAAVVLGAATGYLVRDIALGGMIAGGGITLLGALRFMETYPWAAWIPFTLGVIACGYVGFLLYRGKADQFALKAVVPAISGLDDAIQKEVRTVIKSNAGKQLLQVNAAIDRIKVAAK